MLLEEAIGLKIELFYIVKSICNKKQLIIRNPLSTRPWQHVLDPLHGYFACGKIIFSKLDMKIIRIFFLPLTLDLTLNQIKC